MVQSMDLYKYNTYSQGTSSYPTAYSCLRRRSGFFLLSELLLKLGKLLHGNLLFLVQNLMHTFDLLNLWTQISKW